MLRRCRQPSCPDGIRAHPRPYQSRSLGGAGFGTNQVFGNVELAFHAITVRFTLRNLWWENTGVIVVTGVVDESSRAEPLTQIGARAPLAAS